MPTTGTGSAIDRARGLVRLERQGVARTCCDVWGASTPKSSSDGWPSSRPRSRPRRREAWRRALAARLVHRSRRLDQAISRAGSMYVPVTLHAVRIAAKKLRYTLELAAESGITEARPHVSNGQARADDARPVAGSAGRPAPGRSGIRRARARPAVACGAGDPRSVGRRGRASCAWPLSAIGVPRLTIVAAAARQRIVPSLTAAIRRRPARMKAQRRAAPTIRRTTTAWHGRGAGQRKQA